MTLHSEALGFLLRKLNVITMLSDAEEQAIRSLPFTFKTFAAREDVVIEGEKPDHCALIAQGWACRYKMTSEGRRQILSLHFKGEIPDLQSLMLSTMDHSLAAMTELEVATIPHSALKAVIRSQPLLALPLWRTTLIDGAIYREWLLAMGRLEAGQHMWHLFCELQARLEPVGLATRDEGYDFPITQADLSDALGLSVVHVNRTAQQLRKLGLITWSQGRVVINDFDGLAEHSDFDSAYLHQTGRVGAFSAD